MTWLDEHRLAARLSSVFSDARDVTDALRATDIAQYLDPQDLGFLNTQNGDPIETMLGDNYHPGWLEAIAHEANKLQEYLDPDLTPADLISPDCDAQLVYAIDLDSGLLDTLEQWWGVKQTGNIIKDAQELIRKWDSLPTGGYERPGMLMGPTAAVLVTSDGQKPDLYNPLSTMLVSTASHTGRGVEYPLLGLDLNDETGVRDFLTSMMDPSITRETHIRQELQRQQQSLKHERQQAR